MGPMIRPPAFPAPTEREGTERDHRGPLDEPLHERMTRHLSPTDIILRAAATVPENHDPDSEKNLAPWPRGAEPAGQPAHPDGDAPRRQRDFVPIGRLPHYSTANSQAKRRWRARAGLPGTRALRRARTALAIALVTGAAIWLWSSGRVGEAADWAVAEGREWAEDLSETFGLTVARITLEGRNKESLSAIRRSLGVARGDSVLLIDLGAAKARLEVLPWVRTATVERRLPDGVVVHIVEHRPVARWRTKRGTKLVSADGTVIPGADIRPYQHLPLIHGPGANTSAAALAEVLAVEPALARRVVEARRMGRRRWDLTFDNGAVLRLPEGLERAAWRKFASFERRYGLLERGARKLDMRVPDRLVIRAPRLAAPRGKTRKRRRGSRG